MCLKPGKNVNIKETLDWIFTNICLWIQTPAEVQTVQFKLRQILFSSLWCTSRVSLGLHGCKDQYQSFSYRPQISSTSLCRWQFGCWFAEGHGAVASPWHGGWKPEMFVCAVSWLPSSTGDLSSGCSLGPAGPERSCTQALGTEVNVEQPGYGFPKAESISQQRHFSLVLFPNTVS